VADEAILVTAHRFRVMRVMAIGTALGLTGLMFINGDTVITYQRYTWNIYLAAGSRLTGIVNPGIYRITDIFPVAGGTKLTRFITEGNALHILGKFHLVDRFTHIC